MESAVAPEFTNVFKVELDKKQNENEDESLKELELLKTKLPEHLKELFIRSIDHLDIHQAKEVGLLLTRYETVFAKDDLDIGLFSGSIKHTIDTGDAAPTRQRMRRTPLGFEKEEDHLNQMLERGVITESTSEWASPPVLVRKKDGTLRYCIDFRALNKVTRKDAFPLPNIENCLDTLRGSTFMSTLDMAAGYYQIEIDEKDKHKTAFITKYGLFEHTKLPFELCDAPATFSRVIQLVLQGLTWTECLAYLDDVIVLGKSFRDHMNNLIAVLNRFRKYNLKLKPKKCHLFQKEVKFLGKIVTETGISINPESVETITKWPIPKTKRDVESYLGFANYHRDHIKNFAEIAKPLHQIVGSKTDFKWGLEQQTAFLEIQKGLVEAATLSYPNPDDTFVLDTDASNKSIGAELSQVQNGKEVVISYGSKVLTSSQRKYCTTRKELLAVVVFTRHFRHYLLAKPFI